MILTACSNEVKPDDTNAKQDTEDITEDITGDVTGDVTVDVTEDVTEDVLDDIMENIIIENIIAEDKPFYHMDLNFELEKHTISGTEIVAIKNTSDSDWNSVCFRDYPSYEYYYSDNEPMLRRVTAHETAHQWFYSIVGNDQYDEAWLDEGFATFLETVYYEEIYPDYAELMLDLGVVSEEVFNNASNGEGLQALNQSVSDFRDIYTYGATVYNRGGEFLRTLRE